MLGFISTFFYQTSNLFNIVDIRFYWKKISWSSASYCSHVLKDKMVGKMTSLIEQRVLAWTQKKTQREDHHWKKGQAVWEGVPQGANVGLRRVAILYRIQRESQWERMRKRPVCSVCFLSLSLRERYIILRVLNPSELQNKDGEQK